VRAPIDCRANRDGPLGNKCESDVAKLARRYTRQAVNALAEIVTNPDAPPASRVTAAMVARFRVSLSPLAARMR